MLTMVIFCMVVKFSSFCCSIFVISSFFMPFCFAERSDSIAADKQLFFPDIISMLFLNLYKVIKPNINSHVTAIEWTQKFYQTKFLHLQGKKYLFLLFGVTRNGSTLVLSLTILVNLSSVQVALLIAPFSFNNDSASVKIAEIVVFGLLSIWRSDGTTGTFFLSGRFLSLFNKDILLFAALCAILN